MNSSQLPSESPPEVDKEEQYGEFMKQERWKNRLSRKLAHKAVDIADDDPMNNVGNKSGMGWKELAVIGAIVMGGLFVLRPSEQATPPVPATAPTPAVSVPDTEYEVRFFDEDGNRIPIEHRTQQ